jgi:dipeptidyl aminopeptidase/acylaminoacyl peptidase
VDVNYGGSTGYGRAYRERLCELWGVVDVEDCVHAVRYLVSRGDADEARLAIRGGSAGGYTTLCALVFTGVFSAGASYYGVADLVALAKDTHKFESRYLDRLIGPYPEAADIYRQRSPVHFADRISCPVILFQGLEDKVVPPSQAEVMIAALRVKRLPFAYVAFKDESHGFRQADNIRAAAEAELYFYSRIFGFEPGEEIKPIPIEGI